jgi:predicted transcriptional regulator
MFTNIYPELRTAASQEDAPRVTFSPHGLRHARREAEVSTTDLASILGVHEKSVSRWEREDLWPSTRQRVRLERVMAAFGS